MLRYIRTMNEENKKMSEYADVVVYWLSVYWLCFSMMKSHTVHTATWSCLVQEVYCLPTRITYSLTHTHWIPQFSECLLLGGNFSWQVTGEWCCHGTVHPLHRNQTERKWTISHIKRPVLRPKHEKKLINVYELWTDNATHTLVYLHLEKLNIYTVKV